MKLMEVTVDMGPKYDHIQIQKNQNQNQHQTNLALALMDLDINWNDKQRYLLNIMTKYFVLSLFAILSTQIVTIFYSASWISGSYDETTGIIFFDIFHVLLPIDCAITTCCLFLNFGSTNEYYEGNGICRRCHYCSLLWFKRMTKNSVTRRLSSRYSGMSSQNKDNNLQLSLIDDVNDK